MKRTMSVMSTPGPQKGGHDPVAEWDTETVSQQRLDEIEREFEAWTAKGYWAADISVADPEKGTDGLIIHKFDPKAEILLSPPCAGG